jgi:Endoribonuclease L-PSP
MTDIVSVTVYVTDLNDVSKMNEVYKKLMPDPKPARATVQVAGFIGGAKIENSAVAVNSNPHPLNLKASAQLPLGPPAKQPQQQSA